MFIDVLDCEQQFPKRIVQHELSVHHLASKLVSEGIPIITNMASDSSRVLGRLEFDETKFQPATNIKSFSVQRSLETKIEYQVSRACLGVYSAVDFIKGT